MTDCVTVIQASCETADTSPVWKTADTTTNWVLPENSEERTQLQTLAAVELWDTTKRDSTETKPRQSMTLCVTASEVIQRNDMVWTQEAVRPFLHEFHRPTTFTRTEYSLLSHKPFLNNYEIYSTNIHPSN